MIKLLLPLLLIPTSVAAGLSPVTPAAHAVDKALRTASKAAGVPTKLLRAICWIESNHKPDVVVLSDGGSPSYGLCQVKLSTAKWLGFKGKAPLLYNPMINATYAARYLKYQYTRYGRDWVKAVSAYNAGHAAHNTVYTNKVFSYIMR